MKLYYRQLYQINLIVLFLLFTPFFVKYSSISILAYAILNPSNGYLEDTGFNKYAAIFTSKALSEFSANPKMKASVISNKLVEELNAVNKNPFSKKQPAYCV